MQINVNLKEIFHLIIHVKKRLINILKNITFKIIHYNVLKLLRKESTLHVTCKTRI